MLTDYALKEGQVNGLTAALTRTRDYQLVSVVLDNCQITDSMCATLLDALLEQKHLQEFVYKRNAFGEQALEALRPILQLAPPHNLHELRLVNCETQTRIMQDLLRTLADSESNYLRSLALVQMKINFGLHDLADIVSDSKFLTDLDLSANDCMPHHFAPLLKAIAHNKTL